MKSKCKHGFDVACLMCGFGEFEGKRVWFDWAWQEQQKRIDELESELQKQVGLLKAELQSERWNKEAGFKMFFKARDMRGGWNGFECKPEFYDVGGYWYKGGKSHYLYGDEWCDKETALNSLQAFGGDECE
ncbi:hypothetical protein [Acinetobacter brisouii]